MTARLTIPTVIADAILKVLRAEDVPTYQHVGPWQRVAPKLIVGDSVYTFTFTLRRLSDVAKIRSKDLPTKFTLEIAARLRLDIRHSALAVNVRMHNADLVVEVTRPVPHLYTWRDIKSLAPGGIVIGRDSQRRLVTLDMRLCWPGYLVTGSSRQGKTNLMRFLAAQAAARGWDVAIMCLKGPLDWEDLIPVARYGTAFNNEEAEKLLIRLRQEVDDRNNKRKERTPYIMVVVDEASSPTLSHENQVRLGELARIAGSSNILLFVGVQNVGSGSPHKDVVENLVNRLTFRTANSAASFRNTGMPQSGAEKLNRFEVMMITGRDQVMRLSVPRADGPRQIMEALARARGYDDPERGVEMIKKLIAKGEIPPVESDIQDLIDAALTQKTRTPQPESMPSREQVMRAFASAHPRSLTARVLRMADTDRAKEPRRKPPVQLAFRAACYAARQGKIPGYEELKTLAGKTVNHRRAQLALSVAEEWLEYQLELEKRGVLVRVRNNTEGSSKVPMAA